MRRIIRYAFILIFIVSIMASSFLFLGCAGDPIDNLYTMNLYPGTTNTYDIGSLLLRYRTGHFNDIWVSSNVSIHTLDGSPIGGGGGAEVDPIFTASDAFPITAAEIAAWNAHPPLTTGIHGVGAGTVVGTTLVQELTGPKTLTNSVGKGTWTADGVWKLPAMYFNGDITTDRWTDLENNTFLGRLVAGASLAGGTHNSFFGHHVGTNIVGGSYNTAFGSHALFNVEDGNGNIGFGYQTGNNIVDGNYNVMIGGGSGPTADGSYGLYIDRQESDTPLIYGNFNTDDLHFYGAVDVGLDNTNYTSFEDDGTMEMVGAATVWEDLRTPVSAVRLSGTKPPTWTSYKSSEVLGFSDQAIVGNEEQIFFNLQLSHAYLEASNIYPHVHWVPEDNTGGNVRWELTYSWANIDGTFPAATTSYINASANTTTDKHLLSSFTPIDGTGKEISSMLICSLKRNSSNALDTYNGKSAYFLEVDFHYQADTIGSRTEGSK